LRLSLRALCFGALWIGGCTDDAPAPDAGLMVADTGPPVAAPDAGTPDGTCPDACPGQCAYERCIQPERACSTDEQCPPGERCSASGACFAGDCSSHADCGADQRCAGDRCIARVSPETGVMFERVEIPHVHDHNSTLLDPQTNWPSAGASADMGFGGALFDIDGDLDLDLFLGSQGETIGGSPSCIYINESTPAQLRFRPDTEFCQARTNSMAAGFGTDVNADGFHELVITGLFQAELHFFHPERRVIDLLALLPEDDVRRRCFASSALSVDLNYDGRLDLILGCAVGPMDENIRIDEVSYRNLAFLIDSEGMPQLLERSDWNKEQPLLLEAQGVTLGLGAADLNDDGLLDLLVNEDRRIMGPGADYLDPGGIYLRCGADQSCQYQALRYGNPEQEFGAYMGSGLVHLGDQGEFIYVTDETYNRLVHYPDGAPIDLAESLRVDLAFMGGHRFFSWGVVVDDFDRDGFDDLFISNGTVMDPDIDAFGAHFDAVFMQRDGGFVLHSGDLGIAPFTHDDSRNETRPYSSRAAFKADLDNDGFLELIGMGLEGRPRLHREVPNQRPDSPRCTLVPIDRYVPGFGIGHSLVPGDGPERRWDSQGQNRSGTSPFVLSPWTQGHLRFPSGAKVPFDCQNSPGPWVVKEPEWLSLSLSGDQLQIQRSEHAPDGAVSVYAEPSGQWVQGGDGDLVTITLPDGSDRWMIRFGAHWLARRFFRAEVSP